MMAGRRGASTPDRLSATTSAKSSSANVGTSLWLCAATAKTLALPAVAAAQAPALQRSWRLGRLLVFGPPQDTFAIEMWIFGPAVTWLLLFVRGFIIHGGAV